MHKAPAELTAGNISRDLISGLIVFLVALPLCLGIALASNAPLFSGLLAGIVGGLVVGALSGSQTSVSGPAAGLTAIVTAQIARLGSFEAFLLAVLIGGVIQIGLGVVRAGALSAFFPSSVIKGLLAAIGVILILKQIPHLVGHDSDPEGEMEFWQPDHENTFSELGAILNDIHPGAALVGLSSLALLIGWEAFKPLKKSLVPGPLVVVLIGVALSLLIKPWGGRWVIGASHLVQVPVPGNLAGLTGYLAQPDFSRWADPAIYLAAVTIAIVASLETLLNLEAADRLDTLQRHSPPSRELIAQGVGNVACGLIGALPVTSVIVRSSVNVNAGSRTKFSAIFHGVLLVVCVGFLPTWLNSIPLSCLAAILIVTGYKLATPQLFMKMFSEGRYQFAPFIITLSAIVFTDLLVGILIGLGVSLLFILNSNLRRPVPRTVERHLGGEVLHVELPNQVSFLNRAALERVLHEAPRGSHVLLDANRTDYIDPDVLSLIRDFRDVTGPVHGVEVSLSGFRKKYQLRDAIRFVDYSTRELQEQFTPDQVLNILRQGNERFCSGRMLHRDLGRQVNATAAGQHPLAVVLTCIDSRTPSEIIMDMGLGDIFSVRVAGNVTSPKVLGSMEYGCAVAGAKLVLVMGHTRCGAVTSSVNLAAVEGSIAEATGCTNLEPLVREIQQSIDFDACRQLEQLSQDEQESFINNVARQNVLRTVQQILNQSGTLRRLVDEGRIAIVGSMYDVNNGGITFYEDEAVGLRGDRDGEIVSA
ncbi:MAG: bifunctional SulP family inorganic anion transporter/carbonic anhydrase [Planctomycetaceae bacterium]|nr:bifunctional SulP family inorganic anion transporter/carbonic anhydrase [Planctomycetaceae bacterium]